ncbi:MAG: ABC-F type ribosomal protection protein [Clostridia bacterium]
MSLIRVSNLTFAYDGSYDNIFENVSFSLDTDWRTGFVARNGRGKTTFLRLLMGNYNYIGNVSASVNFDYFPFEVKDENIAAIDVANAIAGAESWHLKRELSLLDISPEATMRTFSTLSMGERTKILLAALFCKQNNFLLIDEPTNHLDMHGRALVSEYLSKKNGFILVSHDRVFLDAAIDHILSINRANIEVQRGNYSSFEENMNRQSAYEMRENERLGKEIKNLKAAAIRTRDWSDRVEREKIGQEPCDRGRIGHLAAKMMKRSLAIEKRRENAATEKEKLLKNIERNDVLQIHPILHPKKILIEARDLLISYGERSVFRPVSFSVLREKRIALIGKNGAGKSSILKLIMGEKINFDGALYIASGLKISYVPQDSSFLKGSVMDYAKLSGIDLTLFLAILRKLDFPRVQFEKNMESFSLGQRKKVLLAKSLSESAHLYIWDEPLNYIDILSRIQIEQLLVEANMTILLVEHDRAFIKNISADMIEI